MRICWQKNHKASRILTRKFIAPEMNVMAIACKALLLLLTFFALQHVALSHMVAIVSYVVVWIILSHQSMERTLERTTGTEPCRIFFSQHIGRKIHRVAIAKNIFGGKWKE